MTGITRAFYALLLSVIALFFGFQLFVLNLLVEKNDKHQADISNVLWISSQLETEYLRFLTALDRYALQDGSVDAQGLQQRFDILISRLPLFFQGEKGDLFSQVQGAHETVQSLQEMITRLEPRIQALLPSNAADYAAIRDEFDGQWPAVREIVLDTFLADQAVTTQILKQNEQVYWLMVIALVGALLSVAGLVMVLLWQLRQVQMAEAKAKHERNRALEADKVKSEFLANMSHELRTPLNAIMGFTEVMKFELFGRLGNSRYRTYVDDIHECGLLLTSLIEDILDLSKIEAGKYRLNEQSIDLAQLTEASIRLCQHQAKAEGVVISAKIAEGLPRFYGDSRVLQQILLNLLSNAVKFTKSGGKVSVRVELSSDGSMVLSVADDGIGISEHDLAVALSPFGQVANVMTRDHAGTGLGLPLAKSLVELHGGLMEIESEVGVGTRVTAKFPPARVSGSALAA